MSNIFVAFFAYLIDKFFGEFRFIKHPVIYIGELISFFENRYYKKSVARGVWLVVFVVAVTGFISFMIAEFLSYLTTFLDIIISSIVASMFISHKMLRTAVKDVLLSHNKQQTVALLVGKDAHNMDESDIYKTTIETYAKNLNNGVIAPMFYLLLLGLPGIIVYKAINIMDSMVGHKQPRYLTFGKAAALLDDAANFIPARLTAVLIMFIAGKDDLFAFYENGKKHESPNAGHPITAMALALGVRLGGNINYSGKVKRRPYYGKGRKTITQEDVYKALSIIPK